jgi:hypothetical protein
MVAHGSQYPGAGVFPQKATLPARLSGSAPLPHAGADRLSIHNLSFLEKRISSEIHSPSCKNTNYIVDFEILIMKDSKIK